MKLSGLRYDSPNTFTPKQRFLLGVLPPVASTVFKLLMRTCHIEVRDREHFDGVMDREGRVILGFWHESMALAAWIYRGKNYHTSTSYSFDGEMAARVIRYFGCEAVRGSSSRGGSNSLMQMQKALDLVPCIAYTLDGPRGPRRVSKPGAAILSARTGVPIVPHAFAMTACKRLRSWDRFPVPRPFCRVISAYGAPIPPPVSDTRAHIDETRVRLQEALNALHQRIEEEVGDVQPLDT